MMEDSLEDVSNIRGAMTVSNFTQANSWTNNQPSAVANENSTLLFIAVEYVKGTNEYKFSPEVSFSPQETPHNFEEHVSPLDPNMSSAARYSPSCADTDISYNSSVVVQQLLSANTGELINTTTDTYVDSLATETSLEEIPASLNTLDANLLKQVVANKFLLSQQNGVDIKPEGVLHLVPENVEQEVELLITDETTGISYNVSTQEYLVERCLSEDQHFLDSLDSDLLALDETTLKSQLPDIVDSVNAAPLDSQQLISEDNARSNSQVLVKIEDDDDKSLFDESSRRRSQRQVGFGATQNEEDFLTQVHTITDKPVETRAKATLPASYLNIVQLPNGECGVFARKLIPRQTQFGPLEGLLVLNNVKEENNDLQFLVECEDRKVHRLDVSDENIANWMRYVRKANSYSEQNVVISQHGYSLYFTTTSSIWPKQELLVGYSAVYAKKHNLTCQQALPQKEEEWPCFECDKLFSSSNDLQTHLNVHDSAKQDTRIKKKSFKNKKKKLKKIFRRVFECKMCKAIFPYADKNMLRRHLIVHGISNFVVEEKFDIISYCCEKCDMSFGSEALLQIHSFKHKVMIGEKEVFHSCPNCKMEFTKQEELVYHVTQHKISKPPSETKDGFKCPVCYKLFASLERIQRHMLVHGSEESKPLKCDTCNKRFLNNSALACHLKTHNTDKKIFECPICKESFDHVLHLKIHVPKHCIDGRYTCPHCKKIFREYSIIRKHIRAFHCERKHNCPHCDKPFPTLDKLRMHLLRHSDHREFLCADCGKQFKRKDKLKEHTKRMHVEERENTVPKPSKANIHNNKKFTPKVQPTDYHRFIYKCHACLVGFKRRGMLVNHLAKRHPDISPDSVPELNLPILRTTRDYYCQYCDKVYKSSSKRKAHILKNHPGQALPLSNRKRGTFPDVPGLPNPTFSQTVGSITTHPQACQWCHKQYASKAKLLQHQRKKHVELLQNQNSQEKNNAQNEAIERQEVEEIVIDSHSFKRDFKVSDEDLLSEVVALNNDPDEREHYYQIISIPPNENLNFNNTMEISTSDSRLYRLLTTGNGLLPPR